MPANRFRRKSTWLFCCNPFQGLPSTGDAITSPSWTTTSSAIALQAFSPAESPASASKEARHGALEQSLRMRVEPRGRLVKHHQTGVLQEHAGECNELRLARRQAAPGRAERRVQSGR